MLMNINYPVYEEPTSRLFLVKTDHYLHFEERVQGYSY